ncbi:Sucrase/ferredoxin-like-domain-containing protein [Halteromyces radiatus]|uniref:Sucrase/ferredoxin-like-domain-containing protein n=1 Tax=Halteromyces radiatus TaxID=101107 RepID=UPI00221FDFD1|nr:Sucrase/ferredoxin-like-domain-containing protein [Halteromyces radiatus]KAI8086273.1 Sucrase/ferredoxin-like-domain-containing protein [Halteromyces radiatus]
MSSLLRRIGSVVISDTPSEPSIDIDQIPPTTELVDCNDCTQDCYDHPSYPSYLDIDTETELLGSMKPYGRHVMIATGVTDWAEKIEEDTATLAAQLHKVINADPQYTNNQPNGRIFITNTSMTNTYSTKGHDVLLLPENILISNVTPEDATEFYATFLDQPLPLQPVQLSKICMQLRGSWQAYMNPSASMILICSHRRRDKRCGVTAPILAREFDHILREHDIEEQGEKGTTVLMVSHVGGHKFAGNIICYTHQGTRGIWYGRVNPGHCKQIVEDTILQGKVVKELYRGAMMHSYGPTSFTNSSTCPARIRW